MKKFSLVFCLIFGIFINIYSVFKGESTILSMLGSFYIFCFMFLLIINLFDKLNNSIEKEVLYSKSEETVNGSVKYKKDNSMLENNLNNKEQHSINEEIEDLDDSFLGKKDKFSLYEEIDVSKNNNLKRNKGFLKKLLEFHHNIVNKYLYEEDDENADDSIQENTNNIKDTIDTETKYDVSKINNNDIKLEKDISKSSPNDKSYNNCELNYENSKNKYNRDLLNDNMLEDNEDTIRDNENLTNENNISSTDELIEKLDANKLYSLKKEKKNINNNHNKEYNSSKLVLSVLYVLILCGYMIWYLYRTLLYYPSNFKDVFNYSLADTLILVLIACVIQIYFKVKNSDVKDKGNTIIYGLLNILTYLTFAVAFVIAVNAILGIDLFFILSYIQKIAMIYITIAVSINIIISVLKNNVLDSFDYKLLPTKSSNDETILDDEDIKKNLSIKSLWTLRYSLSVIPQIVLFTCSVLILSTTVYVVGPHQQAVVYRFGSTNKDKIVGQGIHFKLPWPIDKQEVYDVSRIKSMQIGYEATDTKDFLWNQAHDGGEYILLLGNGNEAVSVNIKLMYKIDNLYKYITTATKPEEALSNFTYESLMYRTINTTLDELLSVDRASLSKELKKELVSYCDSERIGLTVSDVIVESIHPPIQVADVYQKVVTASLDKNTIIIHANALAQEELINAHKENITVVNKAKADQHIKLSEAKKEMEVYKAAINAYRKYPKSFKLTKYLDTYEKVIGGNKVYVFSPKTIKDLNKFVIGKKPLVVIDE